MAVTTFIVGLDQLSIQTFEDVVTARGIERVIVVATNSEFVNNSSQIAAINSNSQISNLRNNGVEFLLAVNDGSSLSLSNSAYDDIKTSGLPFLTPEEFSSITSQTAIVSGNVLSNSSSDVTVFPEFSASGNTVGVTTTTSAFGSQTTISASSGSFTALSDFSGSISLNVTASDFVDILNSTDSSFLRDVRDLSNIQVDSFSDPATQTSIHFDEEGEIKEEQIFGENYYKYDFELDGEIEAYNGTNRIPNFSVNPLDDRSASSSLIYVEGLEENLNLSALQLLTLPDQGLHSHLGESIVLRDSVQNVQALLPQLTVGQLQSINQIELTDGSDTNKLYLAADIFGRY